MRWGMIGVWAICMALNLFLWGAMPQPDGTVETAAAAANNAAFRAVISLIGWGALVISVIAFIVRKRPASKTDAA